MRYAYKSFGVTDDPREAALRTPGAARSLLLAALSEKFPSIPVAGPTLGESDLGTLDRVSTVREEIRVIRVALDVAAGEEGRG